MYVKRVSPARYIFGVGATHQTAEAAEVKNERILLVGGENAWRAAGHAVKESLEAAGNMVDGYLFRGECSYEKIEELKRLVLQANASVVVGVGGGKVIDASRLTALSTGRRFVAVPTIAATCAAWSALSIMYTEDGKYIGFVNCSRCPDVTIVDPEVIANAPSRYMSSGIADAIAKWYELELSGRVATTGDVALPVLTAKLLAKQCLDELFAYGAEAVADVKRHMFTSAVEKAINASIILPGMVSGLAGEAAHLSVAHGFYNISSLFAPARKSLHGERVGFGLIVQGILEGREEPALRRLVQFLQSIESPTTLSAMGLGGLPAADLHMLAEILANEPMVKEAPFDSSPGRVEEAILKADELGSQRERVQTA